MIELKDQELFNTIGGTKIYTAPLYKLFVKTLELTYSFIKSLIR